MNLKKIEKELKELFNYTIIVDEGVFARVGCTVDDPYFPVYAFDLYSYSDYIYLEVYDSVSDYEGLRSDTLTTFKTYDGVLKALKILDEAFKAVLEISDNEPEKD